jgi:hypothetical protein
VRARPSTSGCAEHDQRARTSPRGAACHSPHAQSGALPPRRGPRQAYHRSPLPRHRTRPRRSRPATPGATGPVRRNRTRPAQLSPRHHRSPDQSSRLGLAAGEHARRCEDSQTATPTGVPQVETRHDYLASTPGRLMPGPAARLTSRPQTSSRTRNAGRAPSATRRATGNAVTRKPGSLRTGSGQRVVLRGQVPYRHCNHTAVAFTQAPAHTRPAWRTGKLSLFHPDLGVAGHMA